MAPAQEAMADSRLFEPAQMEERALAGSDAPSMRGSVALTIENEITALEQEWREFERRADCTAFQCYDWLATWLQHVGGPAGTRPVIVLGRSDAGELLFILPLALERSGLIRRLTFLGRDLCDYNAPLLCAGFDQDYGHQFDDIWREICKRLQSDSRYRHDLILLDKMPDAVGAQRNPFTRMRVTLNPSGAYRCRLWGPWEDFYAAKRSSNTRRRDRSKRRRLGESGPISLVTPESPEDIAETLGILMGQKQRSFARMGVPNIFDRPGYRQFFLGVATIPADRRLVHVSRLAIGPVSAAATNLGIEFRGTYYHVLASYDDGPLSRFGPGVVHLQELMTRALDRGNTIFDFTIGDEPYKRDWSDIDVTLYDLVSAENARGFVVATIIGWALRAKRAIKHSKLWPLATKLRRRIVGSAKHDAQDDSEP